MNYPLFMVMGWLLLWSCPGMASGVLKLSSIELRLAPDERQGELYAQNTGDSTLFLDVQQALVLNPGDRPERLLPIGEVMHPALLVTPTRLVLAPGQKYRMNLQQLTPPRSNQVRRVTFRPREHLIVQASDADSLPAPLSVSVGYGMVIYQKAANASVFTEKE